MSSDGPPASRIDRDLAAEREHLAGARAALRRMRERAQAMFATGDGVAGDDFAAETLGTALARRVAELADDPSIPLFFGKLRFGDRGEHAGRIYHVGRRHVTDDTGEPMVLDWRAPVSRAFYRASVADPYGIAVRRRFGFAAGELTSYEDEHLERGEELGTASRILTAEIERPRVGPMRDVVATIQPDQDELVRADLDTTICVQGAPGTGKTAVGLHRAAYLLYLHRDRLRRSGVLVVGPHRAFLRYIEAVLPALGEVDVRQATIDELLTGVPVRAVERPAVAAVKHLTFPEVQTLLDGVTVGGHKISDERQVLNLADSARELLSLVREGRFALDKPTSDHLHAIVAGQEAFDAGHFLGEGAEQRLTPGVALGEFGRYLPPETQPGGENLRQLHARGLTAITGELAHPYEQALAYFLFGALQQFYFDGNKRTARYLMDGHLMSHGIDAISVPARRAREFNTLMVEFYRFRNATRMVAFLTDCHPDADQLMSSALRDRLPEQG